MSQQPAYVVAVTSGKGGVGKTSLSTNLAVALAKEGGRVCLFDADTGLANVNIMLGLQPVFTLADVLHGDKSLDEILLTSEEGLEIVPAASGLKEMAELGEGSIERLSGIIRDLQSRFDFLVIDTAAGIGETVISLLRLTKNLLLVITPEPTSLTDAFSVLKVLKRLEATPRVRVVVNQVNDERMAKHVYQRFASAVEKYLEFDCVMAASIPNDAAALEAIRLQRPLMQVKPDSPAARAIKSLAGIISKVRPKEAAQLVVEKQQKATKAVKAPPPELEKTLKEATAAAEKLQSAVRKIHEEKYRTSQAKAVESLPRIAENMEQADLATGAFYAALLATQEVA